MRFSNLKKIKVFIVYRFRLRNSLKSHLVGHTQGPKAGEFHGLAQVYINFNFSFFGNRFRFENR